MNGVGAYSKLVSIIIPVAPYHLGMVEGAIASANAQTIPCDVIAIEDTQRQGAGYARNEGVSRAVTPFITFLDADDALRPDFVELTAAHYQRGRYVYVDDYQGASLHQTPDCGVYTDGTWHTITTLLPRAYFQAVGGFDESLPLLEDCELYLRLQAAGICGVRCPHPLLWYTKSGQRSKQFREDVKYRELYRSIYARYRGQVMGDCAKCGGNGAVKANVPNDGQQPGDLLVLTLYEPHVRFGPVTGRQYPRPKGPDGYRLWVAPEDVAARPNWWRVVNPPIDPALAPTVDEVQRLAAEALRK